MKKILVTLICAFATLGVASAQQKGEIYVGGDFGVGVNNTSMAIKDFGKLGSSTNVDFTIQPKVGFFVADNLMLGFGLGYSLDSVEDTTNHAFTIGPSLSYYIPLCEKLYYTPTLDLAFCYAATDDNGVPGFGIGVTLFGMEYRPSKKIGISGNLLSFNYTLLAKNGTRINTVDFGLTINPTIGVKFYF